MGRVVLASASATRIRLLADAGVSFDSRPARIDERAIEKPLIELGVGPLGLAEALAAAKAMAVAEEERGGALVLGVDQVLDCDGAILHKPSTRAEATRQLEALSGRSHWLHSAIAAVREGGVTWRHADSAKLTMRKLSTRSIELYLGEVGEAALTSVGAYQLEGPGIRLFERIKGDYFTILGLPLLPLLAFLRAEGEIPA